jgi:hypothetical protein
LFLQFHGGSGLVVALLVDQQQTFADVVVVRLLQKLVAFGLELSFGPFQLLDFDVRLVQLAAQRQDLSFFLSGLPF